MIVSTALGMSEPTIPLHETTPRSKSDFCLAGAFGLDRAGQGALRIDLARRFQRSLFFFSRPVTATNSTRQHASHIGEIRSRLPREHGRNTGAFCLPTRATHRATLGAGVSHHWPCHPELPRPSATLLDRTAAGNSFESWRDPPTWSFRPQPPTTLRAERTGLLRCRGLH